MGRGVLGTLRSCAQRVFLSLETLSGLPSQYFPQDVQMENKMTTSTLKVVKSLKEVCRKKTLPSKD